jgi:hypothetical protein
MGLAMLSADLPRVPAIDAVADSSFVDLVVVAAWITGGMFLAVILGGLLSAVVALGVLELFVRAQLQKRALESYFRDFSASNHEKFRQFVLQKYEPPTAGSRSEWEPPAAIRDYLHTVGRIEAERRIPALAQMDANNLYRLHYRQICGQLMSVLNNEAMQQGPVAITPLTDVLRFIASNRNPVLRGRLIDRPENAPRADLEVALREIDGIQAELGNRISRSIFPAVFVVWTTLYAFPLLAKVASTISAASWLLLAQSLGLALMAVFLAAILALGTAVFAAVAFSWFDRILASK